MTAIILIACTDRYYTGQLKESDVAGKWVGVLPSGQTTELILISDGKFKAKGLPFTDRRDALVFVEEAGLWELREVSSPSLKSRWKLKLQMTKQNVIVEWDFFQKKDNQPQLAFVYDLDRQAAIVLSKNK